MKSTNPRLLALFQKRIEGDDALLELARLRFRKAGLGAEFYAANPAELEWLLRFRPNNTAPVVVHLPRDINLLDQRDIARIIHFMVASAGLVNGFVLHDQSEIVTVQYQAALTEIDTALQCCTPKPILFVEYAVGLEPAFFCELHERLKNLQNVSACIDIGHFGIDYARELYSKIHSNHDICSLHPLDPNLPELVEDVQNAVDTVLTKVLSVVRQLASLGKPLHFHLHDGHPLSTLSPFGVSDHLSFFEKIPIPFAFKGKKELSTLFGPKGLEKIIAEATASLDFDSLTFSLEIHPSEGRLPLGDASHLFNHWKIKTNAEKMNYWLSVLLENHRLLSSIVNKTG